jgi:NTE family protein
MKKSIFIVCFLICLFSLQAKDQKIGLALSGGGARGFAHIGLLKVIDEIGLEIDYVSGTSFGALIGALYSLGYSGKEIEDIFLKFDFRSNIDESISRKDLFIEEKRWLDYGAVSFNIDEDLSLDIPISILSGNNMLQKLAKYLNTGAYYQNFDDFPIPFRCNATNLTTGESVTFSQGNLIDVVRASMAFPTLLEPFLVNDQPYVDGGVKDNLPVQALLDMGADFTIANKVNTPLKDKDECEDFIAILNQTININMNVWVEESIKKTDLLIVPQLDNFTNTSFEDIREIIQDGEDAARANLDSLKSLVKQNKFKKARKKAYRTPERIFINDVSVSGNKTIHSSKVKLYAGLDSNNFYSFNQILQASKKCYNTKNFTWVYPKLKYKDGKYDLEIVTKERGKSFASFDAIYDTSDDLVARLTTTLNNIIQKNSKFIASLQLGGVNSLKVDYVKNFGDFYGAYYHLFPYIEESKLYYYNEEGDKSVRIKKLEYGLNLGIGFFIKDILVGEGYLFGFRSNLYQDVADLDLEQRQFKSSGLGLKAYHETLDDLYFPSSGNRIMMSYQKALDSPLADESYEKIYIDLFKAFPLSKSLSVQAGIESGLFRDADLGISFSPYEIGGIDSFTGIDKHGLNEEAFQINRLGMQYRFNNRYYLTMSGQYLYKGELKKSGQALTSQKVIDLSLGYKTPLGPLRLAISYDFDSNVNYFLAFGFTKDMFKLSKH